MESDKEPQQVLSEIEGQINERKKELEKLTSQYSNFMRPIRSAKIDGNEVHLMTGNVIMLKCIDKEKQLEIFETLTKK